MDDLDTRVFKNMGWIFKEHCEDKHCPVEGKFWFSPDFHFMEQELPPISSTWEVCAKYLVPYMWGKGFDYDIITYNFSDREKLEKHFEWWPLGETKTTYESKLDDTNDHALAACKSFMEVELNG